MITVDAVTTPRERDDFIHQAWDIYRGDRNWVPPIISDQRHLLDPRVNPFFEHARAELFLARRDGRIVGRVMAGVDDVHLEVYQDQTGFFGFFESVNDEEVAGRLFDAARTWLRGQGMRAMRGPLNPSQNEECGVLIEGFDGPPMIMMTYNPRYYLDLLDRCGLAKAKDLFAYYVNADRLPAKLERMIRAIRSNKRIRVRPIDLRHVAREAAFIRTIYNEAWSENWGATPMTDREFDDMVARLKPLVIPALVPIAFFDDEPVGISLTLPDYNAVAIHLNGRLGPVEMVRFLFLKRRIRDLRLIILGVRKAFRRLGIDGLLYWLTFTEAARRGFRGGEVSWILEDNVKIIRPIEMFGGKLYRKYRLYQTAL